MTWIGDSPFIHIGNVSVGECRKPYLHLELVCDHFKTFKYVSARLFEIDPIHNKGVRYKVNLLHQVFQVLRKASDLKALLQIGQDHPVSLKKHSHLMFIIHMERLYEIVEDDVVVGGDFFRHIFE